MSVGAWGGWLLAVSVTIALFHKCHSQKKSARSAPISGDTPEPSEIFRMTLDAIQAAIWEYRPQEKKIYLGDRSQWHTILGQTPEKKSLTIKELKNFIHPDDWPLFSNTNREYIASGGKGGLEVEIRTKRKDGSLYWVLFKGKAVEWDKEGSPTRIVGLDINIQSLMEAQEKLHQSEEKFRAIFENAPYPISIRSLDEGTYLEANRAFLEGLGLDADTLRHTRPEDLYSMDRNEAAELLDEILAQGAVINRETSMDLNDGRRVHLVFSSVLLEIQGQKRIVTMSMNETERKRAKMELKESEARFRNLFGMAPLPMAHISFDGKILALNDRLTRTMGYTIDNVPSLEHAWETSMPDPEIRDRITSKWQKDLQRAMADNSEVEPLECNLRYHDGTVHTVVLTTRLITDGIIVGFYDITKRKEAEETREKLQAQLLQSQKMEAVGILAGGVAHDFNNMLGAIMGYTELIMSQLDRSDKHFKNLEKILDAAKRSGGLTRQLLAFARKESISPQEFGLNKSITAILKMIRRLIGENIELVWLPGPPPCRVQMDPSQFDQVLLNLCVNARDAIPDVGKITIRTETVFLEKGFNGPQDKVGPGSYALLTVSDNGCGMGKETLTHIFEPFFTTKEAGKGTGMGLASVYGIVKQNGGSINVSSDPGKGTTFSVHLPVSKAKTNTVSDAPIEDVPLGRGETVLIVEDDPMLLEISAAMLQRLGYSVLEAGTPEEALKYAGDKETEIHLFITDVVMPKMNGRDLAHRLLAIRPGIKHLFMSGYTANIVASYGVLGDSSKFIQKPFSRHSLAVKIRQVLDE